MIKAYLLFNGALYILLGLWCTILPRKTADFLGLSWSNNSGRNEYITVYGGMEFGIGLFLVLAALRPSMHQAGILFMLCFYAALVVWRTSTFITLGTAGIARQTFALAATEWVLGALALWLVVRGR